MKQIIQTLSIQRSEVTKIPLLTEKYHLGCEEHLLLNFLSKVSVK